jgi:pimeloyl-ACP methyl ester carboxylesterase
MTPSTKARFVAAAALPLLLINLQPSDAAPQKAQMPVSSIASAELRMDHISIVAMGKGSPVILIPGLSSPRAVWEDVTADLARNHRVILVQVNGFAGDNPGENLKAGMLDGVVADLDAYIAKNKLGGAAVVGHSLGGLVGLMLARTHPADVGKLMVVDSLPYVGEIFLPGVTVAQVEPRAKMMRDGIVASYGKPADAAQAEATANGLAMTPGARAKVKAWAMAADPRVVGEALYEDMTTDLRPDVAAIATPITAIYPKQGDALYHSAYGKAPHVTYVPVDATAHFVMLDQPEAFAKALTAFLSS